jgi:hypothetical protein
LNLLLIEDLIQARVEGMRRCAAGLEWRPIIDACFAGRFCLPIAIG